MSQPQTTTGPTSEPQERPCPECGEMVRRGLVRCWNCAAFMNPKLEAKFQEMQANPAPMLFSPVPSEEIHTYESGVLDDADDEEGFELSMPSPASAPAAKATPAAAAAPATAAADATVAADAAADAKKASLDADVAVAHSVATGGDVLLQVALQEQAEERKRRKKRTPVGGMRTAGGFIIFCPYGCKIEVKDSHRGKQGVCPKCRAPFVVPVEPPDYEFGKAKQKADAPDQAATPAPAGFQWLSDLHVHTVSPEKLKLKADSLLKDFAEMDFGFGKDSLVMVSLAPKKGGLFGGGDAKKKPELREAIATHFREGKPVEEAPAGEKKQFPAASLNQLRVVQPTASRAESMFAGVPVFGAHRIAVMLPILDESSDPQYVSFGVMEFRTFVRLLGELYGLAGFGGESGVPLVDSYAETKCHILGTPVRAVEHVEWYKADPTVQLQVAGWKCGACSLVISEEARKKEKLGGKDGKGMAKHKCPKCQQKMGDNPLYALPEAQAAPRATTDRTTSDEEQTPPTPAAAE